MLFPVNRGVNNFIRKVVYVLLMWEKHEELLDL